MLHPNFMIILIIILNWILFSKYFIFEAFFIVHMISLNSLFCYASNEDQNYNRCLTLTHKIIQSLVDVESYVIINFRTNMLVV